MFICKSCVNGERLDMALNAALYVFAVVAGAWLLIKIDPLSLLSLEARSQETAAVRSVAPKISTESDDSPKIFYRWPNR